MSSEVQKVRRRVTPNEIIIGIFAVFVVLFMLYVSFVTNKPAESGAPTPTHRQWSPVAKGQTGQLFHDDGSQIWMADSPKTYATLANAVARGRKDDMLMLQRTKAANIIPSNTRVRVVDRTLTLAQVSVVEGPLKGLTGWVETESVYPEK